MKKKSLSKYSSFIIFFEIIAILALLHVLIVGLSLLLNPDYIENTKVVFGLAGVSAVIGLYSRNLAQQNALIATLFYQDELKGEYDKEFTMDRHGGLEPEESGSRYG